MDTSSLAFTKLRSAILWILPFINHIKDKIYLATTGFLCPFEKKAARFHWLRSYSTLTYLFFKGQGQINGSVNLFENGTVRSNKLDFSANPVTRRYSDLSIMFAAWCLVHVHCTYFIQNVLRSKYLRNWSGVGFYNKFFPKEKTCPQ